MSNPWAAPPAFRARRMPAAASPSAPPAPPPQSALDWAEAHLPRGSIDAAARPRIAAALARAGFVRGETLVAAASRGAAALRAELAGPAGSVPGGIDARLAAAIADAACRERVELGLAVASAAAPSSPVVASTAASPVGSSATVAHGRNAVSPASSSAAVAAASSSPSSEPSGQIIESLVQQLQLAIARLPVGESGERARLENVLASLTESRGVPETRDNHSAVDDTEAFDIHSDELCISEGRTLGRGAMAEVLLGSLNGLEVAVKRMHVRVSKRDREYFLKEVELLHRLRHPNVVLCLGACTRVGESNALLGVGAYSPTNHDAMQSRR
jgi:hypothetical protein